MRTPDDLREWAAEYRRARQSPDALAERIQAAIRSEERREEDGDDESLPPEFPSERWGLGLTVGAVLGVAALLLLSLVGRWVRPQLDPDSTPQQAPFEHISESEDAATSREPSVPPRAGVAADPVLRPVSEAPAPGDLAQPVAPTPLLRRTSQNQTPRGRDRPRASGSETASTAPAPGSSADLLSARQLREAEHMLTSKPGAAKLLLEAHARDNPRSVLSLEREALWIRAACLVGGAPGLVKRRAAFARRADVSAYRAAVTRDCDGPK